MHRFREAGWVKLRARSGGATADLGCEGVPELIIPIKKRAGADLFDTEPKSNAGSRRFRLPWNGK